MNCVYFLSMSKLKTLTNGTPWKVILKFAFPILIGYMFQQVYILADSIIVGQMIGQDAFSVIGVSGSLLFFFSMFGVGFTVGFSALTARYFGSGDIHKTKKSLAAGLILSLGLAIIVLVVALLSAEFVFDLIEADKNPEIYDQALKYYQVSIIGMFFVIVYNFMSSILNALGNQKIPTYFIIGASILNILLDLLFIGGFGMDVVSAGLATCISQITIAIGIVIYTFVKYKEIRLHKEDFDFNFKFLLKHFNQGFPLGFQFSVVSLGMIVLQTQINLLGTDAIAAVAAGSRIQNIFLQPFLAVAAAQIVFVSQNIGAGLIKRVRSSIKQATIIQLVLAVLMAIILIPIRDYLLLLFIDEPSPLSVEYGSLFILCMASAFPFISLLVLHRNVLQGLNYSVIAFIGGILELVGRVVGALYITPVIGFLGIAISTPIAWGLAAIFLVVAVIIVYNKSPQLKLISDKNIVKTEVIISKLDEC